MLRKQIYKTVQIRDLSYVCKVFDIILIFGGGGGIFTHGIEMYLLEHECTSKTNIRVYKPSAI